MRSYRDVQRGGRTVKDPPRRMATPRTFTPRPQGAPLRRIGRAAGTALPKAARKLLWPWRLIDIFRSLQEQVEPRRGMGPGWIFFSETTCNNGARYGYVKHVWVSASPVGCPVINLAKTSATVPPPYPTALIAQPTQVDFYRELDTPSPTLCKLQSIYLHNTTGTADPLFANKYMTALNSLSSWSKPIEAHPWHPQVVPQSVPPLSPQPHPTPVPYEAVPYLQPDVWQSPTERSSRAYYVFRYNDPEFDPNHPEQFPRPRPHEKPTIAPTHVIEVQPAKGPAGSVAVGWQDQSRAGRYHEIKRPPGRTKEGKVRAGGAYLAILGVLNFATESKDVVDILFNSIDPKYRPRGKLGMIDKAQAIYDQWKHLNLPKAVEGLIRNEIEDRFYGSIGKKNAEASREFHEFFGSSDPRGFQYGSAYRNSIINQVRKGL